MLAVASPVAGAGEFTITKMTPDQYFSPNGDGYEDDAVVVFDPSDPGTFNLTIAPLAGGAAVHTLSGMQPPGSGIFGVPWDGTVDATQQTAPPGEYVWTLTGTRSSDGATATITGKFGIDLGVVQAALTAPAAGASLSGRVNFTVDADPAVKEVTVVGPGQVMVGFAAQRTGEDFVVDGDTTNLSDGVNELVAQATWYDAYQYPHQLRTAPRSYTVSNPLSISTPQWLGQAGYFTPNGDGVEDVRDLWYSLSKPATVTIDVLDSANTSVRTLRSNASAFRGTNAVTWDGKNTAGAVVPDGRYTFRVVATASGQTSEPYLWPTGVDSSTAPIATITAPDAGAYLDDGDKVVVTVRAPYTAWWSSLYPEGAEWDEQIGSGVVPAGGDGRTIEYTVHSTGTQNLGTKNVYAEVGYRDPLYAEDTSWGQHADVETPFRAFTFWRPVEITGATTGLAFSPDGDGTDEVAAGTFSLSRDARVTATVKSGDTTVATLIDNQSFEAPGLSDLAYSWNGVGTGNVPAAPGSYTLQVAATDAKGNTDTLTRSLTLTRQQLQIEGPLARAVITPNGDEITDTVSLPYTLSMPATVTVTLEDADGDVVATLLAAQARDAGEHTLTWDGGTVDSGLYTLAVRGVTAGGKTASYERELLVDQTVAGSLTLGGIDPATGVFRATYTPTADLAPSAVYIYRANGVLVGQAWNAGNGTWTVDVDSYDIGDGAHTLYARVWATNPAAEAADYRTAGVALTVDNGVAITGFPATTPSVNPFDAWDSEHETFFGLNQAARLTTEITTLPDSGDPVVVRTLAAKDGWRGGGNYVTWNGRDDDGDAVAPGRYRLTVTATLPGTDETATASHEVLVDHTMVGTLDAPAASSRVKDKTTFVFTPREGVTPTSVVFYTARFGTSFPGVERADGSWAAVDADTSTLPDGTYDAFAVAGWNDEGGWRSYGTRVVPLIVRQDDTITGPPAPAAFTPDDDGQDENAQFGYRLSRPATVTAKVFQGAALVATVMEPAARGAGEHVVIWDGSTPTGTATPGRYTLELSATESSSGSPVTDTRTAAIDVVATPAAISLVGGSPSTPVDGTVQLRVTPIAGLQGGAASLHRTSGYYSEGHRPTPGADGNWTFDVVTTQLPNGPQEYRATIQWVDAFGITHWYTTPQLELLVANAVRFLQLPAPTTISPNNDNINDTYTGPYQLTLPARVVTTIARAEAPNTVLATIPAGETAQSFGSIQWDGTIGGQPAENGEYLLTLTATEQFANLQAVRTVRVTVTREVPGAIETPAAGATVPSIHSEPYYSQLVTFYPTPGFHPESVKFYSGTNFTFLGNGLTTGSGVVSSDKAWFRDIDTRLLHDGEDSILADVVYRDGYGQRRTYTASVPVKVDSAADVRPTTLVPPARSFSPDGDGVEDAFSMTYDVESGTSITTQVLDASDTVVRTVQSDDHRYRGRHTVWWDGKLTNGDVAPDGAYTVRVLAKSANGSTDMLSFATRVETDAPVLVTSLSDGAVVSDTHRLRFTANPALIGVVDTVAVRVNRGPLLPVTVDPTDPTARFTDLDLPASITGSVVVELLVKWAETAPGFTGTHSVVMKRTVTTDETTLTLTSRPPLQAPAPLSGALVLDVGAANGDPVRYSVDPNLADATNPLLTGTIEAPYDAVTVPYTYASPGFYTAGVEVFDSEGNRRHDVWKVTAALPPNQKATATLGLSKTKGVAPVALTATPGGSDTDSTDPLEYVLDWGDGSPQVEGTLPTGPLAHSYAKPGTYYPRLSVFDGRDWSYSDGQSVTVGEAVPLKAATASGVDSVVTIDGKEIVIDGSASEPAAGITGYRWTVDGEEVGTDPTLRYTFVEPKETPYVVTLTVTDESGATATMTQKVTVLDKENTSFSVVTVNGTGGPLPGASVAYYDSLGNAQLLTTDSAGKATIYGLADGSHAVDVYASGYTPAATTVTVDGKLGSGQITLVPGELGEVKAEVKRLDLETIKRLPIDLTDPANQNIQQFDIEIPYWTETGEERRQTLSGYTNETSVLDMFWSDPDKPRDDECAVIICSAGGPLSGGFAPPEIKDVGGEKVLFVMKLPVKGSSLKEFFSVDALIVNLSTSQTVKFTKGEATLTMPGGLALAPYTSNPQTLTQKVADIPGGGTANVSWVVRGDKEGTHPVSVKYHGELAPFGIPVDIESKPADVKVYGTTALQMIVQAPQQLVKDQPAHIRIGLKNVTPDAVVYNLTMELPSQGDTYSFAFPQDAKRERTQLEPEATWWEDYYLVPNLPDGATTGELDLTQAAINRSKGTANPDFPDRVELLDESDDPAAKPVQLRATETDGGDVDLDWDPVKGATEYLVYSTTDLSKGFGGTPVATTSGTTATVPNADSYEQPTFSLRRMSSATMAALTAGEAVKTYHSVVAVVNGAKQMRHNIANSVPRYDCGTDGSGKSATDGQWNLKGCLNKVTGGWLAKGPALLNGLEIKPKLETTQIKFDAEKNQLSTNGIVEVGLRSGDKVITLMEGQLAWDLPRKIGITLDAAKIDDILGLELPASAAATIEAPADKPVGTLVFTTKVKAPALLGGSEADVQLTSTADGIKLDAVSVEFANASFGALGRIGAKLTYDATTISAPKWAVDANGQLPGASKTTTITGSIGYDAAGALTSGTLKVTDLQAAGLLDVSVLNLAMTSPGVWGGTATLTVAGAAAQNATFAFATNDTTDELNSASITAAKLSVPYLVDITSFAMSYQPGKWTFAGNTNPTAISGALTVVDGAITTGNLHLKDFRIGGVVEVNTLDLAYAAGTQTYDGGGTLTFPGLATSVSYTGKLVKGQLESLHATVPQVDVAGVVDARNLVVDYSRADHTYSLKAGRAVFAGLGELTDFELYRDGTNEAWGARVTGAAGGASLDIAGVVTFDKATGAVKTGWLEVTDLTLGGLVPLGKLRLDYAEAAWRVKAGVEGGPTISVGVKDGEITDGKIDIPEAKVAGVFDVEFHGLYDKETKTWAASGTSLLPGDTGKFDIEFVYVDGKLDGGKLSGHAGLKGGLMLDELTVSYTKSNDQWHGDAKVTLPGGTGAITGSLTLEKGQFKEAKAKLEAGEGKTIPIGSGFSLKSVDVTVGVKPLHIKGQATLVAGPQLAGLPALQATVLAGLDYTLTDAGVGTWVVTGEFKIVDNPLGTAAAKAKLTYTTPSNAVSFLGGVEIGNKDFAKLTGQLQGWVDSEAGSLGATATAEIYVLGKQYVSARAVASNVGLASCVQVDPKLAWKIGVGMKWGEGPKPLDGVCDLTEFGAPPAGNNLLRGFSFLSTGVTMVHVAPGQRFAALKFIGDTAPPRLTVYGPAGEVYGMPATKDAEGLQPGGRHVVFTDAANNATYFLLDRPTGGDWTATTGGQGSPIAQTQTAGALPAVSVTGALSGDGPARTLTWTLTPIAGQTVRFVEQTADGASQELGTTTEATGSVPFTALPGAGERTVRAVVEQNGLVRSVVDLVRYTPQVAGSVVVPPEP